jgi:Calcineurin-like phosphoesterase
MLRSFSRLASKPQLSALTAAKPNVYSTCSVKPDLLKMPSPTVSTRFMVISDTHNYQIEDAELAHSPFREPVPKCDVLLHCGDLTEVGGVPQYKRVLEVLKKVPAELKLVIAGNHDRDLDKEWWGSHPNRVDHPEQHEEAVAVMTGPLAKEAGVTYLEEGIYSFILQNGAKFTVYASPWQPEFYDWAFNYDRNRDRFNLPEHVAPGVISIAQNPIPDFGTVDIIMTHGPPKDILDWTMYGNVGCDNILRAVSRARPRLHCFGHIHEGHGADCIIWRRETKDLGAKAIFNKSSLTNSYPEPNKCSISFGRETLFVNASIMNVEYMPVNAPWLVDLDLPQVSDRDS